MNAKVGIGVESLPLAAMAQAEDGIEWGLTWIPHYEGRQTFIRLSVRGVVGGGSNPRREIEFDDEVSREQAQASFAALARALDMGAMLMGSLDEVLVEKRRERQEIDKKIAELQADAKVLRVEERELERACERIARARGGVAELRRRSDGPGTQEQLRAIFEAEPMVEFIASQLAERIGKTPAAVATALSTMVGKGQIERVGRGVFAAVTKAKKK